MRLAGGIAALTAASMASAGVAQTATNAFECSLPYADAMGSMAAFAVTGQSKSDVLPGILGPAETVEFAPGDLKVFGQKPQKISLTVRDPSPNDSERIYSIQFQAEFPHDRTVDRALIAATKVVTCGEGTPLCQREGDASAGPKLRFYRDPFYDDGKDNRPGQLQCEYRLREQDIAQ